MPVIENTMKAKLEAGGLAVSFGVSSMRLVSAAGIARACGFDWLFIDTEHSTIDLDTASQICLGALPTGITPIVRVPSDAGFHASRCLDGGAMGVIVPHVDTPEQSRSIVANCRFPPLGHRSLTAPVPQLGFAAMPAAQAIDILNRNTLVIVMIETPQAVANADAIAAVPGVDGLLVGTNDLAASLGIPGELGHGDIEAAYGAVIAACRRHGRHAGMGGVYAHELMTRYIRMGVRFLLGGSDTSFLMAAARERAAFLSSLTLE